MRNLSWRRFGDLLAIPLRNGLNRPTRVRGSGVKMINMGELFAYSRIGDIEMERVPVSEKEEPNYLLKDGDLLFARQSLVYAGAGKCSIFVGASESVTFEGHLIRARLDRKIADPYFYFYLFNSQFGRRIIETIVEQVAAAGIRGSDLAELEVPYIPIKLQRAIAHILGTLDDKIELNRRMNATLEAIARAIFRSWFVDFDPVHAKARGEQPSGMDAATAALFPDSFEESELGPIPAGWGIVPIGELTAINDWTLRKHDELERIEYIEISKVMRGDISEISIYDRGDEPSRARRRLRHGDTVLSTVRPDRGAYFLCLNPSPYLIASTGFAVVTPVDVPWSFVYAILTQPEVSEYLGNLADGGAYPAVRPEIIGKWGVAIPNDDAILSAFHEICAPLYELADHNRRTGRTVAELRDTLLPKLISGELRVG